MTQRRATGSAFGGVVEHDVQHHFQTGRVQRGDHVAEFLDLPSGSPGPHRRGVRGVRSEEADRVVAPVVRQSRSTRKDSGTLWWIGSSSTVVTPRSTRCCTAASCAKPA